MTKYSMYDVLMKQYGLNDILDAMTNIALQQSNDRANSMAELWSVMFTAGDNSENSDGFIEYTPHSFTYDANGYQAPESTVDVRIVSVTLADIMIELNDDILDFDYVGDLNITVCKPQGEANPFESTSTEYEDYLPKGDWHCGFDEQRGVWVLMNWNLVAVQNEQFENVVDDVFGMLAGDDNNENDNESEKEDNHA